MGATHQPVRVVISRKLDLPSDSHLARTAGDIPVWLIHGPDAPQERRTHWASLGAKLIECPLNGRTVDVSAALQALGNQGLTSVFCEGGGALAASLLAGDLVDDLIGFTAGLVLGAEGQPGIGAMGLDRLSQAPRFALQGTRQIEADVLHHWRRA